MKRKIGILSLGCPRNLVDAEALAGRLKFKNYSIVEDIAYAQVVLVNTCAFIEEAKRESIDVILDLIELKKQGIAFTPHFVASHDSVYYTVARGIYPAGGGVVRTLNSAPPEIREQFRVLGTTYSFTPHTFAVNPRVTYLVSQALDQAFIKTTVDPAAAEILNNLSRQGWDLAADKDCDDVRNLHVDIKDAPVQQ